MSTISYLSIPIDEVDNRLHKVVENSNDLVQLHTYMNSYAKVSDLSAYASKADLTSYAKTTDLATFATKTDLTTYAKTTDLSYYATKTDLTSYAKVSDLGSYAKTSDLTPYATISYVNSSILNSYNLSGISLSHVDSVYTLMQGTNKIGDINVPKDLVVQSGEIVKDPEGMAAGTYIKLTLNATEATPIYINVQDLVNVYHAKMLSEGDTDGVQVTISETNEISARISGNINADKVELYDQHFSTYLSLNTGFNNVNGTLANINYNIYTLNSYVNTYVGTLQTYVDTVKSNITTLNADVNTVGSVDYKLHEGTYILTYILNTLTDRITYLESLVIK